MGGVVQLLQAEYGNQDDALHGEWNYEYDLDDAGLTQEFVVMDKELEKKLKTMTKEQKEERFAELSAPISNPQMLDGGPVPESSMEELEERESLKKDLGY